MSNFFTSPSAGPPQFGFAPGIAGPRENFLSQLTQATSGGVTQGPTQLQQSGAKALEGMLGTAPEFNTAANPDSAIPFLQELGPYAPYIQAIESRIKQRLPTELAQVGEKYAGGYGGTSDWLRSLQETQAKGETDIAAAVAPAVLQAQQLGANTALGSVYAGSYMKPTLSPEAQSLQSLISGGTASAPQAYEPSTGEQVLNAMAQLLPWLFSGGGGGFGSPSGGGGSSASGILDFLTGAKNLPELGGKITDWLGGLGGGGGCRGESDAIGRSSYDWTLYGGSCRGWSGDGSTGWRCCGWYGRGRWCRTRWHGGWIVRSGPWITWTHRGSTGPSCGRDGRPVHEPRGQLQARV